MKLNAEQIELKAAVEKLIFNGCNYNIEILADLYDRDLRIVIVNLDDSVIALDYQDNLSFFIAKRDSGAAPLDTAANFRHIEVVGKSGYVVVVRQVQLSDKPQRFVFSLNLRLSEKRWKVYRETAVATSI
jgi:hypothetical protein